MCSNEKSRNNNDEDDLYRLRKEDAVMFDSAYLSLIGRTLLGLIFLVSIHDVDGYDLDDDFVLSGRADGRTCRLSLAHARIPGARRGGALVPVFDSNDANFPHPL